MDNLSVASSKRRLGSLKNKFAKQYGYYPNERQLSMYLRQESARKEYESNIRIKQRAESHALEKRRLALRERPREVVVRQASRSGGDLLSKAQRGEQYIETGYRYYKRGKKLKDWYVKRKQLQKIKASGYKAGKFKSSQKSYPSGRHYGKPQVSVSLTPKPKPIIVEKKVEFPKISLPKIESKPIETKPAEKHAGLSLGKIIG